jgi:elongator complex protein 5
VIGTLLVLDSLNALASDESINLPALLSTFISPTVSLLASYHLDIPASEYASAYTPSPLTQLKYIATTIFTVNNIQLLIAQKAVYDWRYGGHSSGLLASISGVFQGLSANDLYGLEFDMEHRRKSGRVVNEFYYLPFQQDQVSYERSVIFTGVHCGKLSKQHVQQLFCCCLSVPLRSAC